MKREPESEARKGAFHKFEPNFMTGTGLRVLVPGLFLSRPELCSHFGRPLSLSLTLFAFAAHFAPNQQHHYGGLGRLGGKGSRSNSELPCQMSDWV